MMIGSLRPHRPFSALSLLVFCLSAFCSFGPLHAQNLGEVLETHNPSTDATIDPTQLQLWGAGHSGQVATAIAPIKPEPFTLAVMSDLHVREENMESLRHAVKAINLHPEIDSVALLGDLNEKVASPEEFSRMTSLTKTFADHVFAIPGNHDYMYADHIGSDGKKSRGTPSQKAAKLERFRKAFKQKSLRFSRKAGGHLLVFLPADALDAKPLVSLSDETVRFFRNTLADNRDLPTIVFCHAPLDGSLEKDYELGREHGMTHPIGKIKDILQDNPQVFLWVAGHMHIKPSNPDFHSDGNKVGNVTVIHMPNITEKSGLIRTLKMTPAKAVVRVFDTEKGKYIGRFDRTFRHQDVDDDEPGQPNGNQIGSQSSNPTVSNPTGSVTKPDSNSGVRADLTTYIAKLKQWLEERYPKVKRWVVQIIQRR